MCQTCTGMRRATGNPEYTCVKCVDRMLKDGEYLSYYEPKGGRNWLAIACCVVAVSTVALFIAVTAARWRMI